MEAPGAPGIERFLMEMDPKDAADFLHGLAVAYREVGQFEKSATLLEDIRRTLSSPEEFWQDNPVIALRLAHNAITGFSCQNSSGEDSVRLMSSSRIADFSNCPTSR